MRESKILRLLLNQSSVNRTDTEVDGCVGIETRTRCTATRVLMQQVNRQRHERKKQFLLAFSRTATCQICTLQFRMKGYDWKRVFVNSHIIVQ